MTIRVRARVGAAALGALASLAAPIPRAEAATVSFLDGSFRAATSGEVFVHFFTGTAGYTSDLYGNVGTAADPFTLVGTSNVTPAGQGKSLGFANVGDLITLKLFVHDTQDTFSSG